MPQRSPLCNVAEDLNLPSAAYRPMALELGIFRNAATHS